MANYTECKDDIVVTGMAGQFPNSRTAKEYVDHLMNKVNLCDEDDRRGMIKHPEIPKVGGKLHEVDHFDAGSFDIHPLHAQYMDPVGRILLEQVCQALFDAGVHPEELKGTRTGVFTGGCASEYEQCLYRRKLKTGTNLIAGTTRSMNAQRVSYCLQLNGPSLNLDTACSSGMYALDAAYRAMLAGNCDRAIVGGTNVTLEPLLTLQFARLGLLNYGNGCRPFDNDAMGYTRSEAVLAVFLQKRSGAKRIYGTLVHSNCNADGFKYQGITFPSSEAQLSLLKDVYGESQIDPKAIGFLEAHATGTRVGDPEELIALNDFFKPTKEEPLLIGSVKGNIGHTEPSSGLCSLVKVLHAFNTGQIPPNIHYDKPKEGVVALEEKRLVVVTEPTAFPEDKQFSGINCFGFGGANCHIIMKKHPGKQSIHSGLQLDGVSRLVCYSGRDQTSLDGIHETIETCNNLDSINLIQELFKTNFDSHLYRGFTIFGKNIRSSNRAVSTDQDKIMLILGTFMADDSIQELMQIPLLRSVLKECKNQGQMNNPTPLFLFKALRELNVPIELFDDNELSNSIRKYFLNEITDDQLRQKWRAASPGLPKLELIAEWIKTTSIYGKKGTIISIGNTANLLPNSLIMRCNLITFDGNLDLVTFLTKIGRLHELGFNPQVQKFYVKRSYPVARGTDMLSHLYKWRHRKYICLNWDKSNSVITKRIDLIKPNSNKEHVFYKGHLIDNRNLFPATGYLWRVWSLFADCRGIYPDKLSVVFENVRFHRACTIGNLVELFVSLEEGGGFEIAESGTTIVTGVLKLYDEKTEESRPFITDEEEMVDGTDSAFVLTAKDTYRELRLRGYNYGGQFRAIHEVTPTVATLKWENNWVTFLDNMMQVCILHMDTRNLYVPVGVERLVIRAREHMEYVSFCEEKMVKVKFFKDAMTIRSKFIEIRGLNAKAVMRRKDRLRPVLENHQFVPNEYATDLATSVRINIQLLLECKQTVNFKMAEVISKNEQPEDILTNKICNAIEDLPLVIPDITIVTPREDFELENCKIAPTTPEDCLLIVCKDPDEQILIDTRKALMPDGFLLCFCPMERTFPTEFAVLTKHYLTHASKDEQDTKKVRFVYLLRQHSVSANGTVHIDVSKPEMTWLKSVQHAMKSDSDVVLLAQDNFNSGIMGFINCLSKEPGNDKISCVFIQDQSVLFDPNNNEDFINKQLQKRMKINIFRNGQWGTYRHLVLSEAEKVHSYHWYAKTLAPGDLSSLSWVQGPILPGNPNNIKVVYSALNFRDLMLASGKLSAEAITTNRFFQDILQGFELVGHNGSGKAFWVLGNGSIANMSKGNLIRLNMPDHWNLEDAATVFTVYATVIFALKERAKIERGQSILIHSATGGVGLAALNVCAHFDCEIFVTVGTQRKRDFLRDQYPHIKASHIGNSRDTSFRELIMHETNGRGVDIVLNSLAEEKLQASIECVAHGGVFVEIGKYDLDRNNELLLDIAAKECKHIGVMMDTGLMDERIVTVMKQLWNDALRDGYIKPLPRTVFQINELEKAFRYMSTGNHIGKVLIKLDHEKEHTVLPRFYCDESKSYIIFGGLGGFGLELADWLIMRGAKYIILSSRTGVTTGYQRYRISIWKSYGVKVTILTDDVTNYDICYKALRNIHDDAPIDGVFNLAVVLKDAIFEHQTLETMQTSMIPKAILTSHLDKITRDICPDLRNFVVFSSVSCGRGNAGQTNYGYSNSVMERICEMRHFENLPALAIQWGAVGDVGLLEALQKEHNEIAIGGTLQQKVGNCLEVLDKLLLQKCPIVSSILVAEKFNKRTANSPLEAVMNIIGLQDIKSVSHHTPLPELGMDSMMAVEIKQVLERDFDIILEPADLRNLTVAKVVELSSGEKPGIAGSEAPTMELLMSIPGMVLAMTNKRIVDFNESASKCPGDFILAFPGIDADYKPFEIMSDKWKMHVKIVNYDEITMNQENVDAIVDFLLNALCEEIKAFNSFKFMAHSVGGFAALELIKRLEALKITGRLILLDSAPELMYSLFGLIKLRNATEAEFECDLLNSLLQTVLPQENLINVKEQLLAAEDYGGRVDILRNFYMKPEDKMFDKLERLTFAYRSRVMSVPAYKARKQDYKITSNVLLCKPKVVLIKDMVEDYNISAMCDRPIRINYYEGNHISFLMNDELHEQLFIEFRST